MTEIQQQLQQAQQFLGQNRADKAEAIIADVLACDPDNIEARYTLAVALRVKRRWSDALESLEQLIETSPNFGRAHQEAGLNQLAMGNMVKAGSSFEKAVSCDPSLINSWQRLAKLYRDDNRIEPSQRAQEQLDYLQTLPRELLTVISYLSEDRLADAERLCKYFLRAHKTHVEGMRLLAEIATRSKVYEDAEFLLESCIEFEPGHRNVRIQYVNVLLRMQKFDKAYEQAEELRKLFPDDTDTVLALYSSACMGIGDNAAAIESYHALLDAHPDNPVFPVSLAHVYKSEGELDKAVELYRRAYELRADYGDAYWSLANTKSYTFTDTELQQMHAAEAAEDIAAEDRIQLCFALGKAHEDLEQFEKSFAYYETGNSLKRATTHHDPRPLQVRVDAQVEVCTPQLFATKEGLGFAAPDPIFVVGLPRAGSTLLEQILSSHSLVDGTMELHNILNLAKRLRGRQPTTSGTPRYPQILAELEDEYFARFGEQFIDETRAYRGTAPFFIDEMPNNFFHVGLIRLILPNAKIIDARRHPMGCCFSGFKQLFGEGQEFSYGLDDIGNYYREYVRLMDHWDTVLPGFVLRVHYEDVVADLETQVRRLLEFCELPFEDACLQYHKTERSIRTPSAEQVRQPIYKKGVEQWRNYASWLEELEHALGPAVLARFDAGRTNL